MKKPDEQRVTFGDSWNDKKIIKEQLEDSRRVWFVDRSMTTPT